MTVIPDTHEYVVGWRTFDIHSVIKPKNLTMSVVFSDMDYLSADPVEIQRSVFLASPYGRRQRYFSRWPAKYPMVATCGNLDSNDLQDWDNNKFSYFPSHLETEFDLYKEQGFYNTHINGNKTEHTTPARNCSCGIYAVRLETGEGQYTLISYCNSDLNSSRIFGTVAMWGRVLRYKNGYRAQYAYPLQLFTFSKTLHSSYEKLLKEIYGVDLQHLYLSSFHRFLNEVKRDAKEQGVWKEKYL